MGSPLSSSSQWLARALGVALAAAVAVAGAAMPAKADRTHTVRSGDTLSGLAKRYRTTVAELRRANRLRSDRLRIGKRLTIPSRSSRRRARRGRTHHTVERGDSLSRIARRHDTTVSKLRRANRLRSDRIRVGQRLRLPGRRGMGHERPEGARPSELTESQTEAVARAEALGLGPAPVAQALLKQAPEARWLAAAVEAASAQAVALEEGAEETSGTLTLPVDGGTFMRGWGSGSGGYHLAVDVHGATQTPILAVDDGIVAYAGDAIRGYGNFVLVLHANGLVSAYAHNHQNLVVAGQHVARGERIALLGATGYAQGPHLHFMLVDGGEHCDPLPLFRPAIARRGGVVVETETAHWSDGRPEGLRCLPRSARPHPGYTKRTRRRGRGRR